MAKKCLDLEDCINTQPHTSLAHAVAWRDGETYSDHQQNAGMLTGRETDSEPHTTTVTNAPTLHQRRPTQTERPPTHPRLINCGRVTRAYGLAAQAVMHCGGEYHVRWSCHGGGANPCTQLTPDTSVLRKSFGMES